MYLKQATIKDEAIIGHWLKNIEECLLVTNSYEYERKHFLNWLEADDQHCYCLMNDEHKVVGYGEIWVDETARDLEFAHLLIDPLMRNRGFGKTLISLLEEKAKSFDFPVIYMRVNPENEKAISCYVSCGYMIDPALMEAPDNKWVWLKKTKK